MRGCGNDIPTANILNKLGTVTTIPIGQNFRMIGAKVVITMILQRFSFSLSPMYIHVLIDVVTLLPKFGFPMILKNLEM